MSTTIIWTPTSVALPPKNCSVIWIAPRGEQIRGVYSSGGHWIPTGSTAWVDYVPSMWRLA